MANEIKFQFYRSEKIITIEFYRKHYICSATLEQNKLQLTIDQQKYEYELIPICQLQKVDSSKSKLKVIVQLETTSQQTYNIFKSQWEIKYQDRYQNLNEIGEGDEYKSYTKALQSVYEKADDKTKENMLKSYYQSQGKVISENWEE